MTLHNTDMQAPKFNFPKINRILKSKEFVAILKNKPKLYGQFFRIYLTAATLESIEDTKKESFNHQSNTGYGCIRLGLIIPKRFCKQASKRNILKRQIREYFRLNLLHHPLLTATEDLNSQINVVFYLFKKLPDKLNADLLSNIRLDLQQIHKRVLKSLQK